MSCRRVAQGGARAGCWRPSSSARGVNHFVNPRFYEAIVPPSLKDEAKRVVQLSGVAELAGGLGVLLPSTGACRALGLIGLLAAVFPANLYMARTARALQERSRAGRSTRGCRCSR